MSSNCPPQLQLSLQPNTTSFKRSFEQFGFDLESPGDATDAGGSGANNGNDRNKRARSASSFSEGSDSMDSSHLSTIASGSSGSSPSRHGEDEVVNEATTSPIAVLGANLSTHSALEPPRLPTPDIQDIEMPDYPMEGGSSESFADSLVPQVPDSGDRYRLSLDRYNPFHSEMSVLRQPQSISPLVPRSPTPPPVLPPLCISEDQTRLSTSTIPFLHPPPESHSTTSHASSFFNNESPPSVRPRSPTINRDNSIFEEQGQGRGQEHNPLFQNEFQPLAFSSPSNRLQSNNIRSSRPERRPIFPSRHSLSTSSPAHFREHLNSALDYLRSPSPLVPGLEDVVEASLPHSHVNNRISRALPNPPTLPPIVTDTDNDNWNQNSPLDIFAPRVSSGPSRDTSSFTSPTTNFGSSTSTSSNGSLDLGDHPLPSPRLHDLHSWMDASSSSSSHSWDIPALSTSSVTIDSMRDSSDVASNQGTFATSSTGQSRAGHGSTASLSQQLTSLSPSGLTSPPQRNWMFMRMSDLEGNRREWPSTSTSTPTSISVSTSTSTSQTDSDSQLNTNTSPAGLPLLSFNRRSADEAAVRSLDQGFDSSLSFSARPSPPLRRSLSYAERLRLHEPQLAEVAVTRGRVRTSNGNISDSLGRITNEVDTGDRGLTNFQTNITPGFASPSRSTFLAAALERLHSSRDNLSGLLGGRVDELDSGDNGSARPSSTSQATSTDSRTGFNNNSRDLYLRNRPHGYGASMIRPGASNSLVSESAVEARRRADRIEVLERVNEAGREDRRNNNGSVGGGVGESLDAQIRNAEANLRQNGMSSIGWDPAPLNRRPTNDLEAREDSRRLQEWTPNPWSHASWRQPSNANHRPSYLSIPEPSILPLPGLPSNDNMDTMIGESIGFRPTDFTSRSALSNNNTRNNQILPSSLYDTPSSSRTTGRPSDYFWLNTSRPGPSDQNSMDTSVSPELPSAPETDIFNSRHSTISNMVNAIIGTSSTSRGQRRHSASSDSSHSDSFHETRSSQPYLGDPPSLPPPDLGGVFDAERHASSIAISDESPETIFVHLPQRSLGDTSGTSRANPSLIDRPPPSIPIQDDANSPPVDNPNIRISYADPRQRHQALLTSEVDAMVRRQRRSHFESRRISAFADEIRGLGGSSGNNPVTNSASTQAQSVGDLQRPPTMRQSNRNTTVEPTERRNHSRSVPATAANPSETPFARYQALDPASFTPGPFRNTVQQLFNERQHAQRGPEPSPSVPPTIPPFSFEDIDLSSLHQRILLQQLRRPTETVETISASNRDTVDERLRLERAIERTRLELQATNRRVSDRPSAARGVSASRSDIHRYLTQQQLRMEASRIEDSETPVSTSRGGGDIQGISHAIDALRHDGLSTFRGQQLIERFRRERESARTRNIGIEPESTPAATSTPAGTPGGPRRPEGRRFFMRRETGRPGDEERRSAFSSAAAQHINQEEQRESEELAALGLPHSMRGRRGRFPRIPPEVIYSFGRQARRGGTFGDYMRDEDFDESYEGLLSLSATLGDVKPKSTPASIISGLETAQYKDWATSESDHRCPICLDDYQLTDQVLKLNNCSHWLHKDCLHQWLQGARTCPVCRKSVYPTSQASPSSRRAHTRHSHPHFPFGGPNPSWRRDHPPPPPPPPGGGVLDPV